MCNSNLNYLKILILSNFNNWFNTDSILISISWTYNYRFHSNIHFLNLLLRNMTMWIEKCLFLGKRWVEIIKCLVILTFPLQNHTWIWQLQLLLKAFLILLKHKRQLFHHMSNYLILQNYKCCQTLYPSCSDISDNSSSTYQNAWCCTTFEM